MIQAAFHFSNPMIEQRELAEGESATFLGPRGVITVVGPDRLTWLHSLLSQNLKNLEPGQSAEALLLDPHGHIEHVIHFIDDGQTAWLIVEAESREPLLNWLNKMVFRMQVVITDRSEDYALVGHMVSPVDGVATSNGIPLAWQDPWPGVVSGGVRYALTWPAKWPWFECLVEVQELEATLAKYGQAGTMAFDALRVAAHRPRQLTEVDEKSLPHEYDWMSTAVHLSKGCYRGQETVAKVHNLGHPPRRLAFLHLDGSGHALPESGDGVFIGDAESARGKITIAVNHYEMGPIALAILSRSVPEDAALIVHSSTGPIAASQEVIVPASAGKAANLPKRNLLMGGKH